MEQDCISKAIEWLYADNNFKDYIWTLIISLISVVVAVFIFWINVIIDKSKESKKQSNIREIVKISLEKELILSSRVIDEIKKIIIPSKVDEVRKFKKYFIENIYVNNILNIDIEVLYSSCNINFLKVDNGSIVSFLSNVKDLINRFNIISQQQDEFYDKYNTAAPNLNICLSNLVKLLVIERVNIKPTDLLKIDVIQRKYINELNDHDIKFDKNISKIFIEQRFVLNLINELTADNTIKYPEIYSAAKACLNEIETMIFVHNRYVRFLNNLTIEIEELLGKIEVWKNSL